MKTPSKFLLPWLTITLVSALLLYFLWPVLIKKNDTSNSLLKDLTGSAVLSLIVYLLYLTIKYRQIPLFVKSLFCFLVVPVIWILIGLISFGVDWKALMFLTLCIGIPNAALPYLEQSIKTIFRSDMPE